MPRPLIFIQRRYALAFAASLVLYEFLTYIANDMIMPAMIFVIGDFHANKSDIATSLTAYILGGASLQLFLGPLSDAYGRRPVMLTGAALFFIFTIAIGLSSSIESFLWLRLLQGTGLCFISVIGYATIQEIFEEMDAVRLIAFMANITIVAPLIGPLLGTLLCEWMSWRYIFFLIAAFSLLALYGLWRYMPEPIGKTTRTGHHIAPVAFSLPVILKNYWALLQNKVVRLGALNLGLLNIACVAWIGISPMLIIIDGHASTLTYALWQIPVFGACIVGNLWLQKMTHHTTLLQLVVIGAVLIVMSLLLTFFLPLLMGNDYVWLMPGLILYFLSLGFATAPMERFILYATPVSKGTTSALKSLVTMIMIGIGVEFTNQIYPYGGVKMIGLFFATTGLLYGVLTWLIYHAHLKEIDKPVETPPL